MTIILVLSIVILFDDWRLFFVFMYCVETSQLICSANRLSGFYLLHGIERNFRTTFGFCVVILAGLQYLYLIVIFLPLSCYSITDEVY